MPKHHFDGNEPTLKKPSDRDIFKPDSRALDRPPPPPDTRQYNPVRRDTLARPVKGLRFLSGFIDLVVIIILLFVVMIAMLATGIIEAGSNGEGDLLFFVIWAAASFSYGLFMEASHFQGTLGKILTGTVIVNKNGGRISFGQALGRNFGKWLTYIVPFWIGYLMVFFTEKGQSLHDLMAGTLVYKKGDIPQSYAETFS